jgi:RHS repeat-associated protein
VAISDSTGAIIEQLSYDPWGRRRNALTWSQMNVDTSNTLNIHGFGAHEHIDLFALIDMGGRVYDPYLGRFIQPDPYIQDITNLQNYNRYTYVYNNPLSYTDPSGYFSIGKFIKKAFKVITAPIAAVAKATYNLHKKAFDLYKAGVQEAAKWVKENYKTLIVVAVAIGVGALTAGIGTGFLATMASGAISGFASSTVSTLLNGGNLKSALTAGLKGAAIGALSAGLSFGVGEAAQALGTYGNNITVAGSAVKVLGHGMVQGGISKLQGGGFSSGFWSGAVSAGWGIGSSNINNNAAQLVGGSIIGGCTSSISGGSFC